MKALILAGGKGTRLRPITFSMAKQLVPVANKPVVEYGLEAIVAAGVTEIGIIVGDTAEAIQETLGDGSRWNCRITYILQLDPLGLAHAVATARDFLGADDFIMYLGDNLIKSSLGDLIKEFQELGPAASILLTEVPNPSDFGVALMQGNKVVKLEEKPPRPLSNLALVGVYIFRPIIHDVIEKLAPSPRGEYEITEAIQGLIDRGEDVLPHIVTGWWKDTGTVEAMLEANRLILEDLERNVLGEVSDSKIEGRVRIEKGARVDGCTIRGPVIIAEGCDIQNSYIGPFSSIDRNSKIHGSELEHSIVLADCKIENVGTRISGSLMGRGSSVKQGDAMPKSLSLVLGDSSQVELP